MDKMTKKLLGYDVRPGHKGRTVAGQLLSIKGLYDKAVEVVVSNLDSNDLKAAIFAIEQIDGKAKQKIDLSGKIDNTNTTKIDISKLSPDDIKNMRSVIDKCCYQSDANV